MPSAGEIFERIGWMLTTGAEERSRQAKVREEEQGYQKALVTPFPQMTRPPTGAPSSTSTSKPTASQEAEQEVGIDPFNPQAMMQSAVLGQPVMLPGVPVQPPVVQQNYPSEVFTQRTIAVPAHRGGGTLTTKPNKGQHYKSVVAEETVKLQALTNEDGTPTYDAYDVNLRAMYNATLENGAEYGDLDIPSLVNLAKSIGDRDSMFTAALAFAQQHVEDPEAGGWRTLADALDGEGIQLEREDFEGLRDIIMNAYLARIATIPNANARDQEASNIKNYFGVPDYEKVLRGKDLGKHTGTAALLGYGPEDPIPRGQSFAKDVIDLERDATRPRLPMEMIESLGKMANFQSTMDVIFETLDNPDVSRHVTGPAKPIRDALEELGLWVDTDRVALRSRAIQMWEILYATRGKQLSDKEIKMSEEFFASVKLPREVFEVRLHEFSRYIYNTQISSLRAHKTSGTDIGDFEKNLTAHDALLERFPEARRDGRGFWIIDESGEKQYIGHPDLLGGAPNAR